MCMCIYSIYVYIQLQNSQDKPVPHWIHCYLNSLNIRAVLLIFFPLKKKTKTTHKKHQKDYES